MNFKLSLVVVVVVNAVNELKLIKHYIRKYSAMTASGWGGLVLILEPLQPYTENDSSMSSSPLKQLSDWASWTYTGSMFQIGATRFRKNSSLALTLLIGSL